VGRGLGGGWIEASEALLASLGDPLFADSDAVEDLGSPLFVGGWQMVSDGERGMGGRLDGGGGDEGGAGE
jgi:hypothetical protein